MSMYKFNFNIKQKKVDVNTNKAINVKSVKEHNKLENLDYEHSGHTGFASQKELETISKKVMTDDERTKLSGIDSGAQVNKIESIKVNGTEVKPNSNKEVNITVNASGAAENAVSTHNTSSTAHSDIRTLVSNAQKKADLAYSLIDGSPKGVYANLSALQTAFPSGASGVYITSDNGHWYYWNGTAWTDGGVYHSSEDVKQIKEDLVNIQNILGGEKIEHFDASSFEACYVIYNTGVREYDKWATSLASNDAFFNYPYAVFIIPTEDVDGGEESTYEFKCYFYDADGNFVKYYDYHEIHSGVTIPANTNFRLQIRNKGVSVVDIEDVCKHLDMSYAIPGLKDDVEKLKADVEELKNGSSTATDTTATLRTFDASSFEACYPVRTHNGVREYDKWATSVASNDAFFVADVDIELSSDVSANYQFVCVVYSKSGMFVKTYDYADTTNKITLPAGTRYRLQIRKNGVSTVDVNDVCQHIYMSSVIDSVCLSANRLADYHNEDIVDFNRDILPAVYASSKYGIHGIGEENFRKKYSLLVTTDIHKSDLRLVSAIEYLNAIPSLDAGCCLGDIQAGDFSENDGTWYVNRVNCSTKPFYTVIGNHDCGNATTASKCGTDAEVVAKFITPTEGKIGITGLATPYYSFKNDAHKLYFIVLYNYDSPETLDGSGNYIFFRGGECFKQAQINWFVSQLNAVPSDYSLVILMHSFPYPNTPHECKFTIGNRVLNGNNPNAFNTEDNIIPSIVDAWKRGASLSKNVNPVSEYIGVVDALNISADFTNRGAGSFICYLVGHSHNDIVAHSTAYPNQLVIGFCATALDNFQNGGSDLPRVAGTKSEDAVTVVSFDTDNKNVNLVRIGSNITVNMVKRDFISIPY